MKLLQIPTLLALLVGTSIVIGIGPHYSKPVPVFHHPHDVCGVVALPPNFPDDPTVFTASYGSMNLFLRSKNRGFGWKNMRSGMLGHKINDCELAPDWETSKTMYVALGKDGLQRSTNGGDTWDPPLIRNHITQVEASELVDGTRSVICGGQNSVWHSANDGESWSLIGEPPQAVRCIGIPNSFAKEPFIAVGTVGDVIYVKDGANEWVSASIPSPVHVIKFSPNFIEDRTIWAGTYGHGLFRSIDRGVTFRRVRSLIPTQINDIVLAPSWPACRDIFLATPHDGVHSSRDGGASWERLPLHIVETYQSDNHYQSLAISARYPEDPTLYCGAYEGLYCSDNGGDNWFELNVNPTRIGRKVAISPQYGSDDHAFFTGYGNPIVVSTDEGNSWEYRSRGVKSMGAYSLAPSPTFAKDKLLLVGMGSGIRRSTDAGMTWENITLKPVTPSYKIGSYETRQLQFSPDFEKDRSVFAVTAAGFYQSKDAGKTWVGRPVPVDWTWRMSIAPDWTRSRTAFLGGYHIWRTINGGQDWQQMADTGKVLGVVCAPDFASSGEVFLVSEERGLLRSQDRGKTWKAIANSFEGFSPTKIRLSPTFLQDQMIFVSTVSGGLFVSHDRGVKWERCAALGSQADTCFDFALSPELTKDKTIFGCTFNGVIKSADLGKTWALQTSAELYDDQRDPWILRGSWTLFHGPRLFGVGAHRARSKGREAVLAFTGTGVRLHGTAGPDHGMCEVLIDGEKVADVDCFAESANPEFVIYENLKLEQGFHDICVRVLGKANPRSTNSWVSIDAAIVNYSPGDDDNKGFARLANLYLSPNDSYARDTASQNKKVDVGRQSLSAKPEVPQLQSYKIETSDAELRDQLRAMRMRLEHMTEDIVALHSRIKGLDQAIRAREKAVTELEKRRRK